METMIRAKSILGALLRFVLLVAITGIFGAFIYAFLFPKLTLWSFTKDFPWPVPFKNSTTIIERTEQVIVPTEEGIERFITAPSTAIVSIVASPLTINVRPTLTVSSDTHYSGVLITNDGLVVTYSENRPITENKKFTVFFNSGEQSDASFVAFDSLRNLAFFQTLRSDTASMAFTNSNDIRPGRRFIAIAGRASGEGQKVATGVISEYARTFNLSGKTIASSDKWEGVFFLDRNINPSFSGGAVVAMNGELIGLLGTTTLDGKETSFVLPANVLHQSLDRVVTQKGESPRQDFGAYYLPLTKGTSLTLGLPRDRGAYLYTPSEKTGLAILSGSLAERLGLRYGDIVTTVNDREINLDWPFSVALDSLSPGDKFRLSIERSGKPFELQGTR